MPAYAQTYLQLHHQIRRMGNSEGELDYLRGTYEFAMRAFSGYVQGYGKSFLSHNVGLASILASLAVPIQVVAAGLVHNVYGCADFGDGQTGIIPTHQKTIIRVVGKEAEAVLATFNTFNTLWWNPDLFTSIRDQLTDYDKFQRTAVLLHIADHLEHNLDNGTLYFYDDESAWRRKNYEVLVEMAIILGYPVLGNEIQRAHQEHEGIQIPAEFKPLHKPAIRMKLVPKSCRSRYALQLKEGIDHWLHRLQQGTASLNGEIRPTLKTVRNWFMPI